MNNTVLSMLEELYACKRDIRRSIQKRLSDLGYDITVSEDFSQYHNYIGMIIGNFENNVTKSINDGGLGYSQSEYSDLELFILNGLQYSILLQEAFDDTDPTMLSYLSGNDMLVYLPLLNYSHITTANSLFKDNVNLKACAPIVLSSGITDFRYMFCGCTALTEICEIQQMIDWNSIQDGSANLSHMFDAIGSKPLNTDSESIPLITNPFDMFPVIRFEPGDALYDEHHLNKYWYDLSKVSDLSSFMLGCFKHDIGNIYAPYCTSASKFLDGVVRTDYQPKSGKQLGDVYLPNCDCNNLFWYCKQITQVGHIYVKPCVKSLTNAFQFASITEIEGIHGACDDVDLNINLSAKSVHNILKTLKESNLNIIENMNYIHTKRPTITFSATSWSSYVNSDYYDGDESILYWYIENNYTLKNGTSIITL